MEIEIALNGLQIDYAERAHIRGSVDFVFLHDFAGALNNAAHATFSDEHVMRFFGEHEPAGACERIQTGFSERAELKFPVAVREERNHEEVHPAEDRSVQTTN